MLQRSTKGGASAPPTQHDFHVFLFRLGALNEGWGFCPTDALRIAQLAGIDTERSTKGGASAPPTLMRTEDWKERGLRSTKGGASAPPTRRQSFSCQLILIHAQRRVGLLPHRRGFFFKVKVAGLRRSTKGGASAPPTQWLAVGRRAAPSTLNEGWGFCPTDALTFALIV